jgi:hypothetical protein
MAIAERLINQGNNHLAILATQNRRPSGPIVNDVAHFLPKISGRVSRVKSHLLMVTVVRVARPFQIRRSSVAIGQMPMATVVSPLQINSLGAA